ncbi:MAG: InlB B-repeat-containing protein [Lachnospiraceae bacterium]|nr:InlB B-repeat-containing protein [Lachnospiraceae bacterium]
MKGKRIVIAVLSLILVMSGMSVFGETRNCEAAEGGIPNPDEDYTGTVAPFTIDGNKTIRLKWVTIEGTDTDPSPITIEPGCTVNIILAGENTLTAKTDKVSAGIYVKYGATLNIYAEEGGSLTVTGGRYGAGIGGVGVNQHASPYNQGTPGVISIYGGRIVAQGGTEGAGIGAGARASGNKINILGGMITALAGNSGAGIGSGYSTSGTTTPGVQAGDFTGGSIHISGGVVRAAAVKFKDGYSFEDLDFYDSDSLSEMIEANGFGAGIGGGYGAASGQIIIEGGADVIAIGSCGGAGIGSGRGPSNIDKYNSNCIPIDITIRGNAKVVAFSPDDDRNNQGGGAAIGSGSFFNSSNGNEGINILDIAKVTAVSENHAAAIGGSWRVKNGRDDSIDYTDPLQIVQPSLLNCASTATIIAVCDGFVDPINCKVVSGNAGWTTIDNIDLWEQEDIPQSLHGVVRYTVGRMASGVITGLQIPVTANERRMVAVQIPESEGGVFFTDGDYVLTNNLEILPWSFLADGTNEHRYVLTGVIPISYGITYHLNEGTNHERNPTAYRVLDGAATLLDPSREGYNFLGWFEKEDLSGDAVTEISVGSIGAKEFWAGWEKKVFDIIWLDEEGNSIRTDRVEYGETPKYTGDTPTKKATAQYSYTFNGWSPEIVPVTEAAEYKAVFYETINTYMVSLDAGDGSGTVKSITKSYGDTIVLSADNYVKEGFEFQGWNTKEDGSGTAYKDKDTVKIEGDLHLYAQWKEIFEYAATGGKEYVYTGKSGKKMVFTVKRSRADEQTYGNFLGLYDGDKEVDAANYSTEKGSLILTLSNDWLDSLPVGEHLLTIRFKDGEVKVVLKIEPALAATDASPTTGDTATVNMWILLLLISFGTMAYVSINRAHKKTENR